MDSRRAADRLQCANNLRQIEQATLAYHDLFNAYPTYFNSGRPLLEQSGKYYAKVLPGKYYSVFSRIAPQLELTALYNQINFQVGLSDTATVGQVSKSDLSFGSPANTTVINVAVSVFICPADWAALGQATCKGTNYRVLPAGV